MNKAYCKFLQLLLLSLLLTKFSPIMAQGAMNSMSWKESMDCLSDNISMFDIKEYHYSENRTAQTIKTYRLENNQLVVNIWERATKQKTEYQANLKCLIKVDFTCTDHCSLILSFQDTGVTQFTENNNKIILANCEISKSNGSSCVQTTWQKDDLFLKKSLEAFKQLAELNQNAQ